MTSIVHIYSHSNPIKKTLHYAIDITSSEAELFAIRCSINQAIQFPEISCIIVITDLIYVAHWIFDLSIHHTNNSQLLFSKTFDFSSTNNH